jgi:hypothetical protein
MICLNYITESGRGLPRVLYDHIHRTLRVTTSHVEQRCAVRGLDAIGLRLVSHSSACHALSGELIQ